MMCCRVQFCSVLYLTLVGPALSRVWVNHWATQGQYRVGDNATLHCTIFSDKEIIEDCNMKWVMPNPKKPGRTVDIAESELYAGRVTVLDNDNTTTITIQNLSMNDTAPLCRMDCFTDGELTRYIGKGGNLTIVESFKRQGQEASPSVNWLSYFLFAVNLLILLVVTVICSTIVCKRVRRK